MSSQLKKLISSVDVRGVFTSVEFFAAFYLSTAEK
jgi:hypothetical protein